MRLTDDQKSVIREAVTEVFGTGAKVRLFGSRLDDTAKGGDIDLLIECPRPVKNADMFAARVAAAIQMRIGEQKIDVLYFWPEMPESSAYRAAFNEGIQL